MNRVCGSCTACCFNCKVIEIQKPEKTDCKNCVGGSGCSIYETRPESCKSFECSWLQGEMFDDQRPDKCGVMVENYGQFRFAMCETDEWKSIQHVLNVYPKHNIPVVISNGNGKIDILKPETMTEQYVLCLIKEALDGSGKLHN